MSESQFFPVESKKGFPQTPFPCQFDRGGGFLLPFIAGLALGPIFKRPHCCNNYYNYYPPYPPYPYYPPYNPIYCKNSPYCYYYGHPYYQTYGTGGYSTGGYSAGGYSTGGYYTGGYY